MLRSNNDDDDEQEEEGESNTDDHRVFDLTAPSPPQLPRQYSVDLMLETYDWKEMECTHPGCLSCTHPQGTTEKQSRVYFKIESNDLAQILALGTVCCVL